MVSSALSLLTFLTLLNYCFSDSTLLFVQTIFRHGERSPIFTPDTAQARQYFFRSGGQLTDNGFDQGRELGGQLRNMYVSTGFLDKRMIPSQMYIVSCDEDRTIMTATAVAQGLFPPLTKRAPPPVHVFPKTDRTVDTGSSTFGCVPVLKSIAADLQINITSPAECFFDIAAYFMSNSTLWSNDTLADTMETLIAEKEANLTVPKWFDDNVYAEAKKIQFQILAYSMGSIPYYNKNRFTMSSGELLNYISSNFAKTVACINVTMNGTIDSFTPSNVTLMDLSINGTIWADNVSDDPSNGTWSGDNSTMNMNSTAPAACRKLPKFMAVSGHDTTVMALSSVLGDLENVVSYTASYAIELWDIDSDLAIKIKFRKGAGLPYKDVTANTMCYVVELEGCPYSYFINLLNSYSTPNSTQYCQALTPVSSSSSNALFISVICLFLFFLFGPSSE